MAGRGADRNPPRDDASSRRGHVREAGEKLVEGMRSGRVRTRSGDRYNPSAIRGYEAALRDRIVPILGGKRLGDVQRRDVQKPPTNSSPKDAILRQSEMP